MNKTEKFKIKANQVHGSIYDYSKSIYISVDEKVVITCPTHGDFMQTPRLHIYKKCGCNACAVERSISTNVKTTSRFIEEAKLIHGDRYDYSLVQYVNARTKVKIICPDHGVFEQEPASHTRGNGCKKCAVRGDQDWFIEAANAKHNNKYSYSEVQYTTGKEKIAIQCPVHGVFVQQAESHLAGCGCPTCGMETIKHNSVAELEIIDYIKQLGETVVVGSHSYIPPKELDIVIPDKNIAFEYNGIFWHSENGGKTKKYHLDKTIQCSNNGIRLIHIFENEWIFNKRLVLSRIKNILGHSTTLHARKCHIQQITPNVSRRFLESNHIQGFHSASVHLGLFYNTELVAVMTFGKSRFDKNVEWELVRFANKIDYSVVGGASKLFKHFIKCEQPTSIISYSDKRWNTGTLYKNLGFAFSHSSSPNYFYFSNKKTTVLLSRQQFQKHKLKDKLEVFDPSLSEWENMKANGYNRIWDCGNDVFIWKS